MPFQERLPTNEIRVYFTPYIGNYIYHTDRLGSGIYTEHQLVLYIVVKFIVSDDLSVSSTAKKY